MYKTKIEQRVAELHKELCITKVPVPLEKVVNGLGIRLKFSPTEDKFSGILLRKNGKALMGINSNESVVRQHFTIAHELGHYFLHDTQDAFVDYRDTGTRGKPRPVREIQANMFASAFLMPRDLLLKDVKKIGADGIFEDDVVKLAQKYAVSNEAMTYRLMNIGASSVCK